jgi:hypothetical protein
MAKMLCLQSLSIIIIYGHGQDMKYHFIILIDDGDLLRLCGRIVIILIFYCVLIDIPLHIALNKTHWNCCHP